VILDVETVDHRFHARKSALGRAYLYQIARRRTAFAKPYVWWVRDPLDLDRVRIAAARVTGLHDFRSFTDDDPRGEVDPGAPRARRGGRARPPRARAVHRVAFPLEDGPPPRGRVRGDGRGRLAPEAVDDLLRERSSLPARLTATELRPVPGTVFYRGDTRDHPLRPALGG